MDRLDRKFPLLIFLIICLYSCMNQNNSKLEKETIKKENFSYSNNWKEDYNGCKGLRNIKLSDSLILEYGLKNSDIDSFIVVFGKPNFRVENDDNIDLYYYYDNYCKDFKIIDSLDKCYAEYRFKLSKYVSKKYSCN